MIELCAKGTEIAVTDDELITPTCTADVARQTVHMIDANAPAGLYHATSQGDCSWLGFAQEIFAHLDLDVKLRPARAGEFPMKIPRPRMSVLNNAALRRTGLDIMPPWQDALRNFIAAHRSLVCSWRNPSRLAHTQ